MVPLGVDYAQSSLVQEELETENVGVALEPELMGPSGLPVDADFAPQQLGPALIVTSGHTVAK